jgi:3-oxoadipate enol-lactonase
MYVRDDGSGDAVLLLHGMPSPAEELSPLARALSVSHRVLLPDLPGYGASERLEPYSMSAAQHAIEAMLRSRGVERVKVVGFSGGAYRALRLALEQRLEVTRVACLAPTPGPSAAEAEGLRQSAAAVRAGVDLGDMLVQRFLAARNHASAGAAAAVKTWLKAAPPEVIAAELEALAAEGDLRSAISRLRVPLLLRVGAEDVATPRALSEEIAAAVPGAELEVVPDCGHALLVEDEEATIRSVCAFLG